MHEFSLVQSLLKQVDKIVVANHGRSAVEVRVEIGPLSGVEPLLVKAAFAQLTAGSHHNDTTLTIDEVPLTAHCPSCQTEFELDGFRFVCPRCGSRATRVIRGDAFRLMSVTVDVPESVEDDGLSNELIQLGSPA